MSDNNSNRNKKLKAAAEGVVDLLLNRRSLTSLFKEGDLVWFWGTPHPKDNAKLLRCDINSDVRFQAKITYKVPGQFYCLTDVKTGVSLQRPFTDHELYPMNDSEPSGVEIKQAKFYDSVNKYLDAREIN